MNKNMNNSEKGQAIVYLVLGLVVFLGFVALAIDGGMALADRRNEQNAADAASLAGGAAAALHVQNNINDVCKTKWYCDEYTIGGNAVNSAYNKAKIRAGTNNFNINYDTSSISPNSVHVDCGGDSWTNAAITVTVDISATTPSNFMQLIFPKPLHNEVVGVTSVDPGGPLFFQDAIVALNPVNCQGQIGVSFHGTGDIIISGGGVFSNGCVRADGAAVVKGDTNFKTEGTDLKYDKTKDQLSPLPVTTSKQVPAYAYDVEPPNCPTDPAQWYDDNSLPKTMSGLYCVNGNLNFKKGPYVGNDVTIYLKDGGVSIDGKESVTLHAASGTSHPPDAIPGIVFYLPPTNHSAIILNGTSTVVITGVVYAPGADIKLTGTNGVTAFTSTQFIGWNVEVGGTQQTIINYNGCDGYIFPAEITFSK